MRLYRNYNTYFIHDGSSGQLLGEYYNGNIAGRYVPGPGLDEPLVQVDKLGNRTWLHADERGSVIAGSDASGANMRIVLYDEYGKRGSGGSYRFSYTGQVHLLSDVYDYKSRNYNARLGRFLQADRIGYGDGMNPYVYVGGDPLNAIDPNGTARICIQVRAPTGPGQVLKCVEVDGDGDGDTADNDLTGAQKEAFANDYRGFIGNVGGSAANPTNLATYGKPVFGSAAEKDKNSLRVASQFAGYLAANSWSDDNKTAAEFRSQWNQIRAIEANNNPGSNGPAVSLMLGATTAGVGYWISFTGGFGYGDSRHMYDFPSDLARAMLHEPWHINYPDDAFNPRRAAVHQSIDNWARQATTLAGFGRCQAIGGFPKC